MLPVSGSIKRMTRRSRVDLPQPLGPISTVVLPRSMERFVECRAGVSAYCLATPISWTSALIVAAIVDRGRGQRPRLQFHREIKNAKQARVICPQFFELKSGVAGKRSETL